MPPDAGEREHTNAAAEDRQHVGELALPAEKGRRERRQSRLIETREGWELAVPELIERLWPTQVFEAMGAKRTKVSGNGLAGGLRHEHLSAVTGRADSRDAVDVDPRVSLVSEQRIARVYPHPYPRGARGERPLRVLGGDQSVVRIGEREEDRITLRAELDAASTLDCATDKATVLGEQLDVPTSERLDEPRGSLDIREQEGDRAGEGSCTGGSSADHEQ